MYTVYTSTSNRLLHTWTHSFKMLCSSKKLTDLTPGDKLIFLILLSQYQLTLSFNLSYLKLCPVIIIYSHIFSLLSTKLTTTTTSHFSSLSRFNSQKNADLFKASFWAASCSCSQYSSYHCTLCTTHFTYFASLVLLNNTSFHPPHPPGF